MQPGLHLKGLSRIREKMAAYLNGAELQYHTPPLDKSGAVFKESRHVFFFVCFFLNPGLSLLNAVFLTVRLFYHCTGCKKSMTMFVFVFVAMRAQQF